MQRGVQQLGMKGVIVNSHTHDEYLDRPKFWEIFQAAEALKFFQTNAERVFGLK